MEKSKDLLACIISQAQIGVENLLECQIRHGFLIIFHSPNDEIVRTFTSMGHDLNSDLTACKDLLDDANLAAQYRLLKSFVCKVYSQQSTIDALPSLRWVLFRKKSLEGEKLPPTRGTLIPHWNIMGGKSIPKGNMYQ